MRATVVLVPAILGLEDHGTALFGPFASTDDLQQVTLYCTTSNFPAGGVFSISILAGAGQDHDDPGASLTRGNLPLPSGAANQLFPLIVPLGGGGPGRRYVSVRLAKTAALSFEETLITCAWLPRAETVDVKKVAKKAVRKAARKLAAGSAPASSDALFAALQKLLGRFGRR